MAFGPGGVKSPQDWINRHPPPAWNRRLTERRRADGGHLSHLWFKGTAWACKVGLCVLGVGSSVAALLQVLVV